ncbi:MAG: zinc-dependent metalloprotease [Moraxellaceae bacterium]|nr:zinc-dependent metalloprotease [Pseudobdellovibrionaceae bacterium]
MRNKIGPNLILGGALLLALTSCTKEIPFEKLSPDSKDQSYEKSTIDTQGDYIYSSSQQNGSMSASEVLPFSTGENKRVKLEIGEKSIRVIEMERDQRYASNTTNNKMVLEIPITHVQYQCAKDKFGECTNKEEEASNISWMQKNAIKVKFDEFKSTELELLPILDSQTNGENCYVEKSNRLIDAKIESDAINFKVERTFVTSINCLNEINKLSDATITAIYQYSMVKTKSVLSPDYKTVSYPVASRDENLFGFFATQNVVLDVDHNNTVDSTKQIMNRWNPNRKEITYYLSDEFAKPENKLVNDLTIKTVNNVNDGLEKAGVNFRINLKQPAGKSPGDIRNSMIVLVEDPVASSVIGYGPQTEDPVTGEIFSARTIMFLGTIKKFVQYTYNDIVAEKNRIKYEKNHKSLIPTVPNKNLGAQAGTLVPTLGEKKSRPGNGKNSSAGLVSLSNDQLLKKLKFSSFDANSISGANNAKVATFEQSLSKRINNKYSGTDLKSKLRYLNEVKNCAFNHAEGALSGISERLLAKFSDDLAPWAALSDSDKQTVIDKILPDIWVNTLIHELGHNLGLRHNFEASTDLANFYSADELKKLDVDHEAPFSSVMDYGNDLKTLPVFGKYDIAALRFGYNREIEVIDGVTKAAKIVKVDSTINAVQLGQGDRIKGYKYCTDQNLGGSITCAQFDLGTDIVSIVKNHIADYEQNYSQRNFRNNRADFSLGMQDLRYARRISGIFLDLRLVTEIKELYRNVYGIPEGHPLWTTNEYLKPYQESSALVAAFFTKILATPSVQCALADKSTSQLVGIVGLSRLNPGYINCSEVDERDLAELAKNAGIPDTTTLVVIGQGGKHINSKKSYDNPSESSLAIDVRGIWIDKALALDSLLKRQLGQFDLDRYSDNYLSQADAAPVMLKLFSDVMTGQLENDVEFIIDGSKQNLKISYDVTSSQLIEVPMHPIIAQNIGVNSFVPTSFQELVANRVAVNSIDTNITGSNSQDMNISNAFSLVRKYTTGENISWEKDFSKVDITGISYVAGPKNVIAYDAIYNYTATSNMETLPEELLAALLVEKKDPTKPVTIPAGASAEILAAIEVVIDLPAEVVEAFVKGSLQSSNFYSEIIRSLPTTAEAMQAAQSNKK